MKASAVYRKAAEILDADPELSGACNALHDVIGFGRWPCKACSMGDSMEDRFSDGQNPGFWLGGYPTVEGKPVRVLALLLMAEIAKDDE